MKLGEAVQMKLRGKWINAIVSAVTESRQIIGLEPMEAAGEKAFQNVFKRETVFLSQASGPWRQLQTGRAIEIREKPAEADLIGADEQDLLEP